ncbi:MAG: hypothetical protein V1772_04080, partial [Chloroflexota bacterium]
MPVSLRLRARLALCAMLLMATLWAAPPPGRAQEPVPDGVLASAPALSLEVSVAPAAVNPLGTVTYSLTLTNKGTDPGRNVEIAFTPPPGFSFVSGSAQVSADRTVVSRANPALADGALRWTDLTIPGARLAGVYGMHTFVQDRCDRAYILGQLDRVRELMGPKAYVKQLLYRISTATAGPEACWVEFANGCYDRDLIPVVRLAGEYGGPNWNQPPAAAPGNYDAYAAALARVVAGLPRREGRPLYVEVWNEPNLDIEWGGRADPVEYGHFLVDAAAALRALGDARIVLLNGALSPGGNIAPLAFIDGMASVPGALQAFDVWAAHPYPGNHPPEYNIHDDAAPSYAELTIDSYLLELQRLADHGRSGLKVLLTETGYALGQNNFSFQGYAPMDENNRADYIARAFRDYWSRWPEVLGVCPYELVDPYGAWAVWDWLYPNGARHAQYDAVRALDKASPAAPGELRLRFQMRASATAGSYTSQVVVRTANAGVGTFADLAPVQVRVLPTATPTRTAEPSATPTPGGTPTVPPVCTSGLANGGFETNSAWVLPSTAYSGGYSEALVRSGSRSLRLGIVQGDPVYSYSTAYQALAVPADATSMRIRFWYHPLSQDTAHGRQYALLLDEDQEYVETLLWVASNEGRWLERAFETSRYAGRALRLYLGVYNDGQGLPTAMYVDDVSVEFCRADGAATPAPTLAPPTATPAPPTATVSPTRTSSPTVPPTVAPPTVAPPTVAPPTVAPSPCTQLIVEGGFEAAGNWAIPDTAYPAGHSDAVVRTGSRAMRLGITDPGRNVYSYSSVEQAVTLPADATLALSFWYYPTSADGLADRQYLLLFDAKGGLHTLLWTLSDARAWTQRVMDLSAYAGQAVRLRWSVYNDGQAGVTAMYLDDVSLSACPVGAQPPPTAAPTPTPRPTVTLVPTEAGLKDDEVVTRIWLPLLLRNAEASAAALARSAPVLGGQALAGESAESALARQLASPPGPRALPLVGGAEDARDASLPVLALDATRRRLAVAQASRLVLMDASTGRPLAARDLPGRIGALAVAEETGALYAALPEAGAVWALNADGQPIASAQDLGRPSNLTVGDGRVYVADPLGRRLVVLDAATCAIISSSELPAAP